MLVYISDSECSNKTAGKVRNEDVLAERCVSLDEASPLCDAAGRYQASRLRMSVSYAPYSAGTQEKHLFVKLVNLFNKVCFRDTRWDACSRKAGIVPLPGSKFVQEKHRTGRRRGHSCRVICGSGTEGA